MRIGRLWLDRKTLSITVIDDRRGMLREVFALRCHLCRRLTLGCRDHWLCGLCEACRASVERDKPA